MIRCLALALLSLCRPALADESWQDTPILTSLWQATSSGDNDAMDRLLDSSESAVSARSGDGRGLAWWAWEFQNVYALASIIVNGGDPLSDDEDEAGKAAFTMCTDNPECSKDSVMKQARGLVEDVQKRKEQRAADREKEDFDDEDEELGDDEF
ncbi:unnamed protein product [Effrenium voratum]|uniref:Uncharacterized protein n=1 Tax=Effrenium voratum TaxID=2562239 RepID=A0AA36MN20_9DINO|nr:unnamed protein product [Effrenium voratum]CAJ1445080.1 unnamed protein product [Effrenium voratum]CAJ1450152.1 unnamed protein product [Effrenium voratum]